MVRWDCKSFDDLSVHELYKISQLRLAVFVVEQKCVFQDCDDRDQQSYHFMGWDGTNLVAYTRLMPPGLVYEDASIGRVVSALTVRGTGIGKELMDLSIKELFKLFGHGSITISAQLYLQHFYETYGFIRIGEPYMEDNILHVKMRRAG